MKALMINLSSAAAAAAFNGQKYIPCKQIPDLSGQKDVPVYFAVGEKVIGEAVYVTAKAQKGAFAGSVQDIYGLNVAWEVTNAVRYDAAKEPAEFGLKRAPLEWCYLK